LRFIPLQADFQTATGLATRNLAGVYPPGRPGSPEVANVERNAAQLFARITATSRRLWPAHA